jgi:hypothetical protein
MLVLWVGRNYEVRRCDALRCHHIYSQFHKYCLWNSKFVREDIRTETKTHRQQSDFINLLVSLILKKK